MEVKMKMLIGGNLTLNGNLSIPSGITNVTAQSVNTTQTLIKSGIKTIKVMQSISDFLEHIIQIIHVV